MYQSRLIEIQHKCMLDNIKLDHIVIDDWINGAPEFTAMAIAEYRMAKSTKNAVIMIEMELRRFQTKCDGLTLSENSIQDILFP